MEIIVPIYLKFAIVAFFVIVTTHCYDEEVYLDPERLASNIRVSILIGCMIFMIEAIVFMFGFWTDMFEEIFMG